MKFVRKQIKKTQQMTLKVENLTSAVGRDDCCSSIIISLSFMILCFSSVRPTLHSRLTVSHNEPVSCCGYSEEFRQVVSCSEGAVSK